MGNDFRFKCLIYLIRNYSSWPLPFETSHTKACHFGYHWVLDGNWRLANNEIGDEITEEDLSEFRATRPPKEILVNVGRLDSGLWTLGHLAHDEFQRAVANSPYNAWPVGDQNHCWISADDVVSGVPCDDAINLTKERAGQNAIAVTVCEEAFGFVRRRS